MSGPLVPAFRRPLAAFLMALPVLAAPGSGDWLVRQALVPAPGSLDPVAGLGAKLAGARIIGLGEPCHTSHPAPEFKLKVLQYLVTIQHCRAVAFEANWAGAELLDTWLQGGGGQLEELLPGLGSAAFHTEEMRAVFQWLKVYNQECSPRDQVHVYGLDVQLPRAGAAELLAELEDGQPEVALRWRADLKPLWSNLPAQSCASLPPELWDRALAGLRGIRKALLARSASSLRYGAPRWKRVLRLVDRLEAAAGCYRHPARAQELRDRSMAQGVRWIAEDLPGKAKLAVWAHNNHLARGLHLGRRWMGDDLARAFGAAYVPVGLFFGGGTYLVAQKASPSQAQLVPERLPAPGPGSLEAALAQTGLATAVWDLREDAPAGLRGPMPFLDLGATGGPVAASLVPAVAFDLIAFLGPATPATPLPPGPRAAAQPIAHAPENLGFEAGMAGEAPAGWHVLPADGYQVTLSRNRPAEGAWCACLESRPGSRDLVYGDLMQAVDATPYRGHRVRFSGQVRASAGPLPSFALGWMRVDRVKVGDGFFDDMADRPLFRAAWTRFAIEGEVAKDAVRLSFGVILLDHGRIWVDGLALEDLGPSVPPHP